jgi:integrase
MSRLRAVQDVLPTGELQLGADDLGTIRAAIDWPELAKRGWDETWAVFKPAPDDPQFGYFSTGGRQPSEALCLVCRTPGHERPARSGGLCDICARTARGRGPAVKAYFDGDGGFPPGFPRPSFGRCSVVACERWAHKREPALCEPHDRNWRASGWPVGAELDAWCREAGSVDLFTWRATLVGWPELVRMQILFGLHEAVRTERRTEVTAVQNVVRTVRATRAVTLAELPLRSRPRDARLFVGFVVDRLGLALTSPEAEIRKDRWDMRVFGRRGGWINFAHLSQAWLREAAKAWCWERLPSFDNPARLAQIVFDLGPLSESLTRHRPDGGHEPAVLGRADIIAFCNDLAHLEATGRLSAYMRHRVQVDTDLFLRQCRSIGLTRPGAPMAGMAEDVDFSPSDRSARPRPPAGDEGGRSIPQVVLEQLLSDQALGRLEATAGPDVRAMVELQARVGRRPGELCGLVLDCLTTEEVLDETGQSGAAPVLVHDMPKVGVRGLRLPIDAEAAAIVASQQQRVRQRHPDPPGGELKLFPAPFRNSRGTRGLFPGTVAENLRDWVAQLPRLVGPDGRGYPRSDITMYALRHSYAQRLADNGTPVEVLCLARPHQAVDNPGLLPGDPEAQAQGHRPAGRDATERPG